VLAEKASEIKLKYNGTPGKQRRGSQRGGSRGGLI
jgi:hypothetical protein